MKTVTLASKNNHLVGTWKDGKWTLVYLGDRVQPKHGRPETIEVGDFEVRVSDIINRYDELMAYITADNFSYRKLDSDSSV